MNWFDYQRLLWSVIKDDDKKYELQVLLSSSRCPKCIYENLCQSIDINKNCKRYKRDPPDGGYYG